MGTNTIQQHTKHTTVHFDSDRPKRKQQHKIQNKKPPTKTTTNKQTKQTRKHKAEAATPDRRTNVQER